MESASQLPPVTDWTWNPVNHRVGPFQLRTSVQAVGELVEKLERYPAEDYDTYLIRGTAGSKLFVKTLGISSIQCGLHFIVEDVDVIGLNAQYATSHLGSTFSISQQYQGYIDYMNEERSLKIIVDESQDAVIWVIYADPCQW